MDMASENRIIIPRIKTSCTQCQRSKKRCDRGKPHCSACIRYERECVYVLRDDSMSTSSVENTSLSPVKATQESEENSHAVFFLDSVLFRRSMNRLPELELSFKDPLLSFIGDITSDKNFVNSYFSTIHPSMPFLSRKKFTERILNPLSPPRPANMLLIATMKLLADQLPEQGQGPRRKAYYSIKSSLLEAENSCSLELRVLQAIILMAVFEVGHAIYPAAYLTVGYCVRYGSAMGLHKAVEHYSEEGFSITESEERRRSWWLILVLDRYINLGCADRAFLTADPSKNSILPIDDAIWEENREINAPVRRLFEPPTTTMGRFSLTAQSAILLGNVFRSIHEPPFSEAFWQNDVKVLDSTIVALTSVSVEEGRHRGIGVCSPSTICFSARLLLHDKERYSIDDFPFAATDNFLPQDFKREIADGMLQLANAILSSSCSADEITPFCVEAIYRSAVFFGREYSRTGRVSEAASCAAIKQGLNEIGKRWKAAALYAQMIDARIVTGIL
ncbi:fungal-specific transcription factor domain-containing protein [Trichoderma austrokoningii]